MAPVRNIVVLNQLAERHITMLKNTDPDIAVHMATLETAGPLMADAEILAAWGWMDIEPLYQLAPNLRWVHALSAGVENLTFPALQASPVILTNSKGIHGIPASEHVLSIMLAFTRGLNLLIRQQQQALWQRVPTNELHEKTIAIVGLGSIGRSIAKTAKCLGMTVIASKRELTKEFFVDRLYSPDQLSIMLSQADFVVVAVPLTEETDHFFGLEQFQAMKKTAYFINIARGSVVNEADLVTALEQGHIQGAGLDVFEHEPLPASSPLWNMPNVIITPHMAAISPAYLDRAMQLFADNTGRYLQGGDLVNVVDKVKGY